MSPKFKSAVALAVALIATTAAALVTAVPAEAASAKCIGVGSTTTRCYYMDGHSGESKLIAFSDSMENDTTRTAHLSCSADKSKTDAVKVSVTVTVAVEEFLVGKAEASVSGEVQESVESGYVTTGSISVPALTITLCDRGIVRDDFKGHYTDTNCSSSACSDPKRSDFTMTGPVRARWWFSDIPLGS